MKSTKYNVGVGEKTEEHPWFNEGSRLGYVVNGVEGGTIVAEKGSTITVEVTAPGHPFYFTTDSTGGRELPGSLMREIKPTDNGTITFPLTDVPDSFYYQCGHHQKMGGNVVLSNRELFTLNKIYDNKAVTVTSPEGSNNVYIAQQDGLVYVDKGNGLEVFLDIRSKLVSIDQEYDERGLLDIAFHSSYKNGTGTFYVFYSHNGSKVGYYNRLSVFTSINWTPTNREEVIFRMYRDTKIHNGGRMLIDGNYIYLTIGDGGPQEDTHNRAQDLSVVQGKVLRLLTNGNVPSDNPFTNAVGARNEIYAYGFRNPWGISKTPHGIFVTDVGYHDREEINILQEGDNYGWNAKEGTKATGYSTIRSDMVDPIYEYTTGCFPSLDLKVDSSAIIGGYYIDKIGYVFADYSGVLMVIDKIGGKWKLIHSQRVDHGNVRSMGMAGSRLMILCDDGIYEALL